MERACKECGRAIAGTPGRGRPLLICGECKRGRRRVKDRPMGVCVDCEAAFEPANHTGPVPARCPECRAAHKRTADAAKSARWRAADPVRAKSAEKRSNAKRLADPAFLQRKRDNELKRLYGLTRSQYDDLVEKQDGKCALCRNEHVGPGERLHVDHCHESKRIRGLLCSKCNTAIGLLNDDPDLADAVAAYLRR